MGIGAGELLIIAIIGIIFLGPKQIPEVFKTLAKFMQEMRKAQKDLKSSLDEDGSLSALEKSLDDVQETLKSKVDQIKGDLQEEIDKTEIERTEEITKR